MPYSRLTVMTFALPAVLVAGALAQVVLKDPDQELLRDARTQFKPLPKGEVPGNGPAAASRVALGRSLFFDPRISIDGTGSCVRCHQPALYGADGVAKSRGVQDKPLPRNSPTILNVGLQFKIHWDGALESVEEQARKSLLGPGFGNPDFATAMGKVKDIPGYVELFRKAFPDQAEPVTEENWGQAIGAYERTLATPSRFDDFLGGNPAVLTAAERKGLRLFMETGCTECHFGAGLGGKDFKKFGEFGDYWKETGSDPIDKGRFNVTKEPDDEYVFKVPGLRNVSMTAPYFHDGSVKTLPEAVRIMGKLQIGSDLSSADIKSIVGFLEVLTGKLPADFATAPVLPPAGAAPAPAGAAGK